MLQSTWNAITRQFLCNLPVPQGSTGVERENQEPTKAPDNCMTDSLLVWFKPFPVRLRTQDQWNIFKRHERVALLSHPCDNTEESSLPADSSTSAWRLFSCVPPPPPPSPPVLYRQEWQILNLPSTKAGLWANSRDISTSLVVQQMSRGEGRDDDFWPQSPVFLL